jgi:ubiquinone/menaquinone biosynthesis C-methylase UbiE
MPDLSTEIHLNMLTNSIKRGETEENVYGMHWGDPKEKPFLAFVRDFWCVPYVKPEHTAIEIGPGGGRWTRHLLGFEKLYAIDYHQELLDELGSKFKTPNLELIKNSGSDFPGVPDRSVDFIFTFGVFVHLDVQIIASYLSSIKRVLKPGGNVVIQYSDKTKRQAARNDGFSNNTPAVMRSMVLREGFFILEENLTVLPHAGLIRFTVEEPVFYSVKQTPTDG